MDEFEIIRAYFDRAHPDQSVRIGVGDDGAVLTPEPGRDLISVVDTLVSSIHFPAGLPPADVGYRAVVVNLSDIAAMAGRPRWMTLALTLREADAAWLQSFSHGLYEAADEYQVSLVGGDVTRGVETVISIQVTGDVVADRITTRSGAAAGDLVFVTGTPGDAAAGLSILESGTTRSAATDYLIARFSRPRARVAFASAAASFVTAAIDVSDGLYSDLSKLLDASGVGGSIEVLDLPLSPELARLMSQEDAQRFALGGGDDYELCFTAAPENEERLVRLGDEHDVRVTRIGTVGDSMQLEATRDGGEYTFSDRGYRHF